MGILLKNGKMMSFLNTYTVTYFNMFRVNSMLEACKEPICSKIIAAKYESDFTACVKYLEFQFDIFVVEVKKTGLDNSGATPDKVKAANEAKIMLDMMVVNRVKKPHVRALVMNGLYSHLHLKSG